MSVLPLTCEVRARVRGAAVAGVLLMALAGCPPPVNPIEPAELPLIVGMEYALSGLGGDLNQVRAPGVKFLPDNIGWEDMQASETAAIDFGKFDRLVGEYQGAGFAECMIGLKSQSSWASVAPGPLGTDLNFAPKPEYLDDYAAWVGAVVERYDGDGVDDMPDLEHPIRYYEVGVELSSYEPEAAADYLVMLEAAYEAAHGAFADVVVLHAAFLTTGAFVDDPAPEEYAAAFEAMDDRIMFHSLDEMRAILDRPDLFDAVNFHVLGYPAEVDANAEWLRWEMDQRGYEKPLVISDTIPTGFVGWGPATVCDLAENQMGIIAPPATEADRCRLAEYFTLLVDGDEDTVAWTRGFLAAEMVKMVVMAAGAEVEFMNTSFTEDLVPLQAPLFRASGGAGAWGGMVETTTNWFTQSQVALSYYPMFYAIQQLVAWLDGYDAVERVDMGDDAVYVYSATDEDGTALPEFWVAWYKPGVLVLPEDAVPEREVTLEVAGTQVVVEHVITELGQTEPEVETLAAAEGRVTVTLTAAPVFVGLAE